jgi:hypothetical protein
MQQTAAASSAYSQNPAWQQNGPNPVTACNDIGCVNGNQYIGALLTMPFLLPLVPEAPAAGGMCYAADALRNATPVGSALKGDAFQRAASFMKNIAADTGTHFPTVGGDGVTRTLTQVAGDLNGQAGRYEYIVDPAGDLTHQLFVPNGTINGIPIKP